MIVTTKPLGKDRGREGEREGDRENRERRKGGDSKRESKEESDSPTQNEPKHMKKNPLPRNTASEIYYWNMNSFQMVLKNNLTKTLK